MNDDRPDQCTMIGLHKMAAQFGDGLVPELYELLVRSRRAPLEETNVTEFPVWQARPPMRDAFAVAPPAQENILAFPAPVEPRAFRTEER